MSEDTPTLNGPAPSMRVTRNSPPKRVRVNDGAEVGTPDGQMFSAGDEVVLQGPVADELELQGHVTFIEALPNHKGYSHADDHGVEHDVTQHRTRLGAHHHATGTKAKEEDFDA